MNAEIDCGKWARARLWRNELPFRIAATREPIAVLSTSEPILRHHESSECALEVLWPTGGRSLYGLLGASFVPAPGQSLSVETCAEESREYEMSMALLTDNVKIGLPLMYVDAVRKGISASRNLADQLGPGNLSFSCAAHGEAGSGPIVFYALCRVIVELLTRQMHQSDAEICSLVRSYLFERQSGI